VALGEGSERGSHRRIVVMGFFLVMKVF